jgi:nicotinamide-nucleotide amidase
MLFIILKKTYRNGCSPILALLFKPSHNSLSIMNKEINELVKLLKGRKLTLAIAESITCGLAAQKLGTCKGTSDVLKGAIVCYSEDVKTSLMRIPKKMIAKYSCESMEVTERLAQNLSGVIKADVYAALTGLASPRGDETKDKPVGTVFLCVKYKGKIIKEKRIFNGPPAQVRTKACMALYELIINKITKRK